MNKVNFDQTGGFPIETNTFSFLQSAYGSLAGLSGLGGQNYILNGCEVAGAVVSNGTVVINGEVLPFTGGAKLARLVIEETVTEKTFEDGVSKPVYTTRVAKMASTGGVLDFDSLKRVSNLLDIADRIKDQKVIKFTPTNSSNSITITGDDCFLFQMGKLVIVTGSFYFVYSGTGSQTGFSLESIPFPGPTVGIQIGSCYQINATDMQTWINTPCTKNSAANNIGIITNVTQNTRWLVNFSITTFLA